MAQETAIEAHNRRWGALKAARSSWITHWRDLSDHILPRRGLFLAEKPNQGDKQNTLILNSHATYAHRVAQAGMMMGMTSPSKPWFRLTVPDFDLAEAQGVKQWLGEVERRMRAIMAGSNIYDSLHSLYGELLLFGTAAMVVVEDYEDVVRCETFTAGEYCLAVNSRRIADTLYREVRMTVEQVVTEFGLENCSIEVQDQYKAGKMDLPVDVMHAITPRHDYDPDKKGADNLPFASCWWESGKTDRYLRKSGFHERALMAPRWETIGYGVYGRSPGMDALPDARALQVLEKRKGLIVDQLANPALQGPASALQGSTINRLPGQVTHFPVGGGQGYTRLYEVHPQALPAVGNEIAQHAQRIDRAFFADLFLMLANSDRRQITAREIEERHEEKLLALGPTLERLQSELLGPLIERLFGIMARKELLPPTPPELEGRDITVDYISILAQAQKSVSLQSVERLVQFAGVVAQYNPAALDKLDIDQALDEYADMLGAPASVIRSDADVAQIREARQAQEQMARMAQMAKPAKDAADAVATLNEASRPPMPPRQEKA